MTTRPKLVTLAVAILVMCAQIAAAEDRFTLDVEGGPAWQLRNDFAVPGDTGTLVRIEDQGPSLAGRATLVWNVSDRWAVRFLAAPLSTDTEFVPAEDVSFEGETFAKGQPVELDYRFDSYRVSGIYRFPSSGRWSYRAGLTVKVRDAEISLRNPAQSATKTNTGVVPLLYGGVRLQASQKVAVDLDGDAAAASQGRAADIALRVETQVARNTAVYFGSRILEGGADNDEVYTFATFAYAFGGVRFQW